jgi:aminopeptidase N
VAAPYTVVGCGTLENEKILEDGTKEFTWTATVPYIGQSMAYGDYRVESREVTIAGQTFPIRVYALKGHEGGARAVLDETEWIIQFYSETFCPYPYEELKMAQTPNFPGGFGACTLICLHSEAFQDPLPRWLLAHELSHQWWGHVVGPVSGQGGIPWLNEGFATYSDILYQEQIGSPNELRRHLFNYAVKFYEQAAYVADAPVRTIDWTSPMYQAVTYHKGALLLHTLRFVMGDEAFFRALQEYVTSHRFDFVTVEDFRQVCEKFYEPEPDSPGFEPEEGQGNLAWFFEQWMDRPGFPILRLADVKVNPSGMKNQLEFSILQEEYVYHLPVEIRISGAQEEKWERVWVGMPNDFFEYELDWTPRKIEMDPNFWIFKDPRPSFTIWKIQE